jgi:glutamyl-tRNA synthetase/glutamyl-Q tRNA(Asp) synthetase
VDDWEEEIDLVVRGMDLQDSTARQIQLAHLLGRDQEPRYLHHPLLVDNQGDKLSKRQLARSIRAERQEGISPEVLLGEVCMQMGLLQQMQPVSPSDAGTLILANLESGAAC